MRTIVTLALLFMLVAFASPMPKTCRGRNCRHLRPAHPSGRHHAPQVAPGNKLPSGAVRRPVAKRPLKLAATTEAAAPEVEQVTEMKMVTDADGQEVREAGVNGWLSEPTPSPDNSSSISRTDPPSKNADKQGSCDTPKGFGIKCTDRFDQCAVDGDCPGATKCCMVGDCGYLCVKPKPVSTGPKEVTKEVPNKKIKGDKTSSQDPADLTSASSELSEAVELPEGAVKLEDIIELPEEMKKNMTEEQEQRKEEERKKQELVGEEDTEEKEVMSGEQMEIKKEESQMEKVVEKLEEFVEEEIALLEEDFVSTTQFPVEEDETLAEE